MAVIDAYRPVLGLGSIAILANGPLTLLIVAENVKSLGGE